MGKVPDWLFASYLQLILTPARQGYASHPPWGALDVIETGVIGCKNG
jgi:hypothetical protein